MTTVSGPRSFLGCSKPCPEWPGSPSHLHIHRLYTTPRTHQGRGSYSPHLGNKRGGQGLHILHADVIFLPNIFHLRLFGSMMGTPGHERLPEQAPHQFPFPRLQN